MRLDRGRARYPTALVVIASFYARFAVAGGSGRAVVTTSPITGAFVAAAPLGCRRSLRVRVRRARRARPA